MGNEGIVPRRRSRRSRKSRRTPGRIAGLSAFAFLIVAAPLAFGAVDRLTQIVLAIVFALGLLCFPPKVSRPGVWANRLLVAVVLILVLKEIAPAGLFGGTDWRTTLEGSYGLKLGWMHHPEPGRAVDAWLAGALAVLWFLWVRTLAGQGEDREVIAWSLLASAGLVAAVSFATRGIDAQAIYGLRFAPGWTGFGPFPNRNHTGCFLAMGVVLGAGCIGWAGSRRNAGLLAAGVPLTGLVLMALLETRSRGGLLAMAAGLGFFLAIVLLKLRTRRAFGVAIAASLLAGGMALLFGAQTIARFSSGNETGQISTNTRLAIWHDAAGMWRDAPLLGHGAGSFASIFPMHQKTPIEMQRVIHPESSWLQWLTEMGLIPVLLIGGGLFVFILPSLREAFAAHSGFFLRASGFGAFVVLLCHSFIDVPAHRWGTAGLALAALAMACPRRPGEAPAFGSAKSALIPLGVAVFWMLPFFFDAPAWSPLQLDRTLAAELSSQRPPLAQLEEAGEAFPLDPSLHEYIGLRLIGENGRADDWQRHFRIANRLAPSSWAMPMHQARACASAAPALALHYAQLAVERGGHRSEELFEEALKFTAELPRSREVWESYAAAHPQYALVLAARLEPKDGRKFFDLWWTGRSLAGTPLSPREVADFYRMAPRWSSPEAFHEWMTRHRELRETDFRKWAAILHEWKADEDAWRLLSGMIPEPKFPEERPNAPLNELQFQYRIAPENIVNARSLIHALKLEEDDTQWRKLLGAVASQPGAPAWFVHKAAYSSAEQGRIGEAVEMMLRDAGA